jgi:hypothetical protein
VIAYLSEKEKEAAKLHTRLTKVIETIGSLETSAHVIKLASEQLGVTQDVLKRFMPIVEEKHVPAEQIDSTLREQALNYKRIMTLLQQDDWYIPGMNEIINTFEQGDFGCD